MIAEVIINTIAKELNKTYDYIIPDHIINDIKIGSRVFVPFGKTKQEEGFVIGLKETSEFANKEIIKLEDNILTKENKVIVEGINIVKKHMKSNGQNPGEIIEVEAPIHASNVMIIDPKTGKGTRIGHSTDQKGNKIRVSKKSNEKID